MFFTYWTNAYGANNDPAEQPFQQMKSDWSSKLPDFRVFDDVEVGRLLHQINPDLPAIFDRIAIPACRSDIARLVLLHAHGGMYVDAHTSTNNFVSLTRIMEYLTTRELIIFDKHRDSKEGGDKSIVNGAMAARRHSPALRSVISDVVDNLLQHERAEAASDVYVPYNIFVITGPWALCTTLFTHVGVGMTLKPQFESAVHVEALGTEASQWPFVFYKYYGYREEGRHWSERQAVERLFHPRPQ
jgi:mannosyltransferase OCH1-like enzyme